MSFFWCVILERLAHWKVRPLSVFLLADSRAGTHTMRAGGRDTLLQPLTCAISVQSLRSSRQHLEDASQQT